MVKGGPRAPVEFRLLQSIDPDTGELTADETIAAIVGPKTNTEIFRSAFMLRRLWSSCARHPLSLDEYFALRELCPAATHAPLNMRRPTRPW